MLMWMMKMRMLTVVEVFVRTRTFQKSKTLRMMMLRRLLPPCDGFDLPFVAFSSFVYRFTRLFIQSKRIGIR